VTGQNLTNSGYATSGRKILEIAKQYNLDGDYFPVWATCLGFELMMMEDSKRNDILTKCKGQDQASPLVFEKDLQSLRESGKMFENLTTSMFQVMKDKDVTINYHGWCLTKTNFNESDLRNKYKILAINHDEENLEYISIVEGIHYPFYGVQFHPEKPLFEFVSKKNHCNIPHDNDAIQSGQYFANFFLNECRKSNHVFNSDMHRDRLIYNFQPNYTIDFENFEQMYFFPLK